MPLMLTAAVATESLKIATTSCLLMPVVMIVTIPCYSKVAHLMHPSILNPGSTPEPATLPWIGHWSVFFPLPIQCYCWGHSSSFPASHYPTLCSVYSVTQYLLVVISQPVRNFSDQGMQTPAFPASPTFQRVTW